MAHSESYTEASPTDATLATSIDDEIVKSRRMYRERFAVDHKVVASDDGSEVYGVHKRVTFEARISTPTEPTNSIATLYLKTADYDCEIRFVDERDVDNKIVFIAEVKMLLGSTIPDGWIALDGSTLGDATSGADYAGDDYKDLFYWLYAELADTEAPVSGGRGVDDDADWAAHKTLTMPDARSRVPIGAGTGAGLTARTIGDTDGDETKDLDTHTHADGTLAAVSHNHGATSTELDGGGSKYVMGPNVGAAGHDTTNPVHNHTTGSTGADVSGDTGNSTGLSAVDVMNPWFAVTYIIKY